MEKLATSVEPVVIATFLVYCVLDAIVVGITANALDVGGVL